jgi:hypothetical protein
MNERLWTLVYAMFAGAAILSSSLLSLCGIKDNLNLAISFLVGVASGCYFGYREWQEWKRDEPKRKAAEEERQKKARKERLEKDIADDPDYARHVLECHDIGCAVDASPEEIDRARKAYARVLRCRHFGLPDNADAEELRKKEDEEYRWLRNRDHG